MVGRDVHEEDLAYLKKVRVAYLRLARRRGWKLVNGEQDSKAIQNELRGKVAHVLNHGRL
jgi:thymidylate kinase